MNKYFWYIVLFFIAYCSKGQWCYLALMIAIAFNEEPIASTFLKLFNKYCDKDNMNRSTMSQADKQIKHQEEINELEEMKKTSDDLNKTEDFKIRWKPYISDNGDLYYDELLGQTINLINDKTELEFKTGVKLLGTNNISDLYPDAISEKIRNKLIMLEVKASCYGQPKTILKRGITSIDKYTNYIDHVSTDKVVDFWLVLVLNEHPSEEEMDALNIQFLEYSKGHLEHEYRLLIYSVADLKKSNN